MARLASVSSRFGSNPSKRACDKGAWGSKDLHAPQPIDKEIRMV